MNFYCLGKRRRIIPEFNCMDSSSSWMKVVRGCNLNIWAWILKTDISCQFVHRDNIAASPPSSLVQLFFPSIEQKVLDTLLEMEDTEVAKTHGFPYRISQSIHSSVLQLCK